MIHFFLKMNTNKLEKQHSVKMLISCGIIRNSHVLFYFYAFPGFYDEPVLFV